MSAGESAAAGGGGAAADAASSAAGGGSGRGGTAGTLGPNGGCPSSTIITKRCFRPEDVPGAPKIDAGAADALVDRTSASDGSDDAAPASSPAFDASADHPDAGSGRCPPPNSLIGTPGIPTQGPIEEGTLCCYLVTQICG